MPGFTADCLETLDEIGNESREAFRARRRRRAARVPVPERSPRLDRRDAHVITQEEGRGWM